ncbi:MAG: PstS family phosphate ABC transporter substrate-binding protein [Candidatus Saccharibacteria bacterium]
MKTNGGKLYFILVMSTFLLMSCGRTRTTNDSMLTGETTIAADEALKPLINAQLDIFHSIYQASKINCKYVSEYDALNLLLKEEIRLAIVGRPLEPKEIDYFKSKDIIPQSIPFATDAIALIVPSSNGTMALKMNQIKQILTGEISDWNQIEGSGMSGSIPLYFDMEASGIIRYMNEKLVLNNKISGNVKFSGSNEKVIDAVIEDKNGIGFVGYNWLSQTESIKVQDKLNKIHFVGISDPTNGKSGDQAFMPSVSGIYNKTYPLTRKLYAVYTDPSASLARGFLALLTSERGQRAIYRMGLKPENDFQRQIRIIEDYK